jgi:hypothetical protein
MMMAWNMWLEKKEKYVYFEQFRKHTRSNSKTLNGFGSVSGVVYRSWNRKEDEDGELHVQHS